MFVAVKQGEIDKNTRLLSWESDQLTLEVERIKFHNELDQKMLVDASTKAIASAETPDKENAAIAADDA